MLSGTVPVKNDLLKMCARGTATSSTGYVIESLTGARF